MVFRLDDRPPGRVDLSALVPDKLAGLGLKEIERLQIGTGKRRIVVGDLFTVSGDDPEAILFEGGSHRFDGIGTGMKGGTLLIAGDTGMLTGRSMAGGRIAVEGDTGPFAGSAMRGGRLEIAGNTGDFAGAPRAGELAGMRGGLLLVRGRAGARVGDRMRRGLIAVLGGCGEFAGSRMIAGTLLVAGECGRLPGYLMRRGTILLDRVPTGLSPTFVEGATWQSPFAALLDRHLIADGVCDTPFLGDAPRRWTGDNAVSGKGEILSPLA